MSSGVARATTSGALRRSASSSSPRRSSSAPPSSSSKSRRPACAGDGRRRARMVAGDDDRAHAGGRELGEGPGNAVAQRVAERDQAEVRQVALRVLDARGQALRPPLGHRDHPQAVVGQLRDRPQDALALAVGQRADLEHGLGRTLEDDAHAVRAIPDGALALALRVEGIALRAAGPVRPGRLRQGAVHGVLGRRAAVRGECGVDEAVGVAVDAVEAQVVLGQRAGLVGHQHGDRADRLRGAEPAQEHALLGEAEPADGDERRDEDRQLLGDRRERERQSVEQHLPGRLSAQDAEQRHQDAGRDRDDQRQPRHLAHRPLQRRRRLADLGGQPAESADLGLPPDGDDHGLAGAGDHCGAGVDHRRALGQRRAGRHGRGSLGGARRLAGQGRLGRRQPVGLRHPGVGGHEVAGLQDEHVAGNQRLSVEPAGASVPSHQRGRDAEVSQRAERPLRAHLGDRLDCGHHGDDREDGDRIAQLAEDERQHPDRDEEELERLEHRLDDLLQDVERPAPRTRRIFVALPRGRLGVREPFGARAQQAPDLAHRRGVCGALRRRDGMLDGCPQDVTDDTYGGRDVHRRVRWPLCLGTGC